MHGMRNKIVRPYMPFRIALLAVALGILAASEMHPSFAGSEAGSRTTADVAPKELAAQCPMVVYARVDTNQAPRLLLLVAEIWKGPQDAAAAGVTNGMRLQPQDWPSNGGPLPDGAVVFIQRSPPSSGAFRVRSVWWTWPAGIGGRTAQGLKAACRLQALNQPD
jgi:hypothetical protein